jgi:TldD protein
LTLEVAEKAVKLALNLGAEYADARVDRINSTIVRLVHDTFDQASSGITRGIGVRVLFKGAWGFAATASLTSEGVEKAVERSIKAAKAAAAHLREKATVRYLTAVEEHVRLPVRQNLEAVGIDRKMEIALKLVKAAREQSSKIVSGNAVYLDSVGQRSIATSDGARIIEDVGRVYFSVKAIAKDLGKVASASEAEGVIGGFEHFERIQIEDYSRRVAERALTLLKAKPAPSGRFTVILDPKLAGTFAHEAVGHACEADLVTAGESILIGKMGCKIGSEYVTIFDDSTLVNGWGSLKYDDEGVPTQKRLLIENGVLKGYILNREASAKLNMNPNGGARAESYASRPIVRMSNTYIAPGSHSFEELLEDVDYGVYVKGTRGGQVDPAKGTFQFSAEEAFLIEKGEVSTPLLDVSLSGLTLETLANIDAVAKDNEFRPGFCGKAYQSVPVGAGSPHIRINSVIVGGRA